MTIKNLFFSFALITLLSACTKEEADQDTEVVNVKVAGLFSLTGVGSALGVTSQAAMQLALTDVNEYLQQTGSRYRFSAEVFDTEFDTTQAKAVMQTVVGRGIRLVIGPESSAECASVLQLANDNSILLISQASTAASLAISDDALFRFCPGDGPLGQALGRSLYSSGKRMLISLVRNDAGGTGLQTSVINAFTAQSGQVDVMTPYAPTTTDFTSQLQILRTKIQQHTATFGAGQVAVFFASLEEGIGLFSQAVNDTVLSSVNWIGGDGITQLPQLINDTAARDFCIATSLYAPNFGLPEVAQPRLQDVAASIFTTTGITPSAYALNVYDVMWVLARTLNSDPGALNDFSRLKSDVILEADQYFGITGPVVLDSNGDRTIGSFDYWGIVDNGGTYSWQVVGRSN